MKQKWSIFSLILALALCGCRASSSSLVHHCPTSAPSIAITPSTADEISVEQLALLLPRHPIVVGFDVDDTLLFSAPAFNALQPQYDADVIRPKDYSALTTEQKAKYHEFWNKLNNEFDDRSTPKAIAKKLLDLHVARGDTIYVISRRPESDPPSLAGTHRLERMFGIKLDHPIVSTKLGDKTEAICQRHIAYYYGDSDSDITAAVAAGAVPIRVRRAANSYAKDAHHDGQLGEIVLKDSDR